MQKYLDVDRITIKPDFCIFLAFLLFLLPVKWVFAWVIASFFHELFHYASLRLLKHKINSITIGMTGAIIDTEPMSYTHELICALSGPSGGLLLLLLIRWFPVLALCSLLLSAYNLLPIYPLDGGRAIRCIIMSIFPSVTAFKILKGIEITLILLISALTVYMIFRFHLGLLPLFVPVSILIRLEIIKFPCKQSGQRVQ